MWALERRLPTWGRDFFRIFYYLFLNFLQCDKVFHANILVQRGLKADMVGKHWYRGISFKLRVFRNQLKIPCFTFE